MKILISPAKTLDRQSLAKLTEDRQARLKSELRTARNLSPATSSIVQLMAKFFTKELEHLYKCNTELAELNYERWQNMKEASLAEADSEESLVASLNAKCLAEFTHPALFFYSGLQYKNIAVAELKATELSYLEDNLYIISALYGLVPAMQAIFPYRLEMNTKLAVGGHKNLYELWTPLFQQALDHEDLIFDLASNEYSKAIKTSKATKRMRFYFGKMLEDKKSKLTKFKNQASLSKMARGRMLNYMATKGVVAPQELKSFTGGDLHLQFSEYLSDEYNYYFVAE